MNTYITLRRIDPHLFPKVNKGDAPQGLSPIIQVLNSSTCSLMSTRGMLPTGALRPPCMNTYITLERIDPRLFPNVNKGDASREVSPIIRVLSSPACSLASTEGDAPLRGSLSLYEYLHRLGRRLSLPVP